MLGLFRKKQVCLFEADGDKTRSLLRRGKAPSAPFGPNGPDAEAFMELAEILEDWHDKRVTSLKKPSKYWTVSFQQSPSGERIIMVIGPERAIDALHSYLPKSSVVHKGKVHSLLVTCACHQAK